MEVELVACIIFFIAVVIIIASFSENSNKKFYTQSKEKDTKKAYKKDEYLVVGDNVQEHTRNIIIEEDKIIDEYAQKNNFVTETDKKIFDTPFFCLEILNVENQNYSDNSNGCSIYFKVTNKSQKRLHIKFDNFTVIKSNNEECDFSCWLTDFNINSTYIYSGNSKNGCIIFKNVNENTINKLIIELSDISNNKKYITFFEQKCNVWIFNNSSIKILDKEKANTEDSQKLSQVLNDKIERIEGFEEKLGISLENIFVDVDKDLSSIKITGEAIRTQQEPNIKTFDIIANFYNKDSAIIKREEENIYNFEGYDSFEITMYEPEEVRNVTKIRLFVKGEIENG